MKRSVLNVVVSYDISNDKKRNKVAELLESEGFRVQYSVFELSISVKSFAALKKKLQQCIDGKRDSIRYYTLCQHCMHDRSVDGKQNYKK